VLSAQETTPTAHDFLPSDSLILFEARRVQPSIPTCAPDLRLCAFRS
jgi:hypothetical protein